MTKNIINELQERNKELLNQIKQLKAPLRVKLLNNGEIKQEIIKYLGYGYITHDPDLAVVDKISQTIINEEY